MNHPEPGLSAALRATLAALSLAALCAAPALAANKGYQVQQASCSGAGAGAGQDRATCLREAAAAAAEQRRGGLTTPDADTLARNALLRCQSQPVADRSDCERRIRGEGSVSGTVSGGGILRELVTVQPAAAPAAASAPR